MDNPGAQFEETTPEVTINGKAVNESDNNNNSDTNQTETNAASPKPSLIKTPVKNGTPHSKNVVFQASDQTRSGSTKYTDIDAEQSIVMSSPVKFLDTDNLASPVLARYKKLNEDEIITIEEGFTSNGVDKDKRDGFDRPAKKKVTPKSSIDVAWLEWISKHISSGMKPQDHVTRAEFRNILKSQKILNASDVFLDRTYEAFLTKIGTKEFMTVSEMFQQLTELSKKSALEKLLFIFKIYDADNSGYLDRMEFNAIIRESLDDAQMHLSNSQILIVIDTLFEKLDTNKDGKIGVDEFEKYVGAHSDADENLKIAASKFIMAPGYGRVAKEIKPQPCRECGSGAWRYVVNNTVESVWVLILAVIFIACFLYGSLDALHEKYQTKKNITTPNCVRFYAAAHGFGFNLNFWVAFLTLLMCRKTLSWIRNSAIGHWVPVDSTNHCHKWVGWLPVSGCVLGHFVFHMIHFKCLSYVENNPKAISYADYLFTRKAGLGMWGTLTITGWTLFAIHWFMFIFALPFIRRSGKFELFFWTHLFYVPYFILLIIHSDKFWAFFVIPMAIFVFEKLLATRMVYKTLYGEFFIKEVILWSSKVTGLIVNHPVMFKFKPGDYAWINIPSIAKFEWHPFTISSAPENPEEITFHVRTLGGWTRNLYEHFYKCRAGGIKVYPTYDDHIADAEQTKIVIKRKQKLPTIVRKRPLSIRGVSVEQLKVPIYIDGPYGAPAATIFRAEYAVLVAAGIGVTPYSSILESIILRCRAMEVQCPDCTKVFIPTNARLECLGNLKKVDFIWVVRHQHEVEWFLEKLNLIESERAESKILENFLNIYIYVTSAKKLRDMTNFFFSTAVDLVYQKTSRNLISGLRSHSSPGRPRWPKVFEKIDKQRDGRKVTVFYCGPELVGKEVRKHSQSFHFNFRKENF